VKATTLLLACALALGGCGDEHAHDHDHAGHAHHDHKAPHGGALQVLGEEAAHVELVLDAKSGALTAYVLDGEAEKPVRVAAPTLRIKLSGGEAVELSAVANPLTGETVGDTSQFEGTSPKLVGASRFDGTLETITARGVKFDAVRVAFPEGNEAEEKHAK
jgi:hypothetical protein